MENGEYIDKLNRITSLIFDLNKYRDEYYNQQNPSVSDEEYDKLFDELAQLEDEIGVHLSNSPTQSVGYEVKSSLRKVKHNHPMLSLAKTKDVNDIIDFFDDKLGIAMLKMDGLTISLRYYDGELISAETRGNGETGEDVLHNVKMFENVPLQIPYRKELIIDGEAIIPLDKFEEINAKLPDEEKYRNARNLASGSVRQLNNEIAKSRGLRFVAWKVVKGFDDVNDYYHDLYPNFFQDKLFAIGNLGFEVVPFAMVDFPAAGSSNKKAVLESMIEQLRDMAKTIAYPIDGIVFGYADTHYGDSLGATNHHVRSQIAFKFSDGAVPTNLVDIEWTMGASNILTPVAVFDPIEIDGSIVQRASLHNVNTLKDKLHIPFVGQKVWVSKRNMIIPQIEGSDFKEPDDPSIKNSILYVPNKCPYCGGKTEIVTNNVYVETLHCTNDNCVGSLVGRLKRFVSRDGMNIDRVSEATIQKFVDLGWLKDYIDFFKLKYHYMDIVDMDGFGEKSVDNLMQSIENSRFVTLDRFLYALCIPGVGKGMSKELAKYFGYSVENFKNTLIYNSEFKSGRQRVKWEKIDNFDYVTGQTIEKFFQDDSNVQRVLALLREVAFVTTDTSESKTDLLGKVFVITGSLNYFKNRDEAVRVIESCGGKVSGSVSKKTNYLVNNDLTSTSGKNKKAHELQIPIINEEELLALLGL